MARTCRTCGAKFPETEKRCPYCGNHVNRNMANSPYLIDNIDEPPTNDEDSSSGKLNVLSVFFPIVGWILYLTLKRQYPRKAKFCKLWAWIGFGIWGVFSFLILYFWYLITHS